MKKSPKFVIMKKMPKFLVIGTSPVLPFVLGDELECQKITPFGEIYEIVLDNVPYTMQITRVQFIDDLVLIEGLVTNNSGVGKIAFKLTY
jgi:predicted acetyltransferase